jgi:hypothetical protein
MSESVKAYVVVGTNATGKHDLAMFFRVIDADAHISRLHGWQQIEIVARDVITAELDPAHHKIFNGK